MATFTLGTASQAICLAPPAFARGRLLAISSRLELGDQARFLELGNRAEHLAHQHRRWCVFDEEIGSRGRDQGDAKRLQEIVAGKLHREIASEPVRAFNEDAAHAVACDAVEHGLEARAVGNGISAAHSSVVVQGVAMQMDGVIVAALVAHGEAVALPALGGEQWIGSGPGSPVDGPAIIAICGSVGRWAAASGR
jgi:hypothetical protein